MSPVREVYFYDLSSFEDKITPIAPIANSVGKKLSSVSNIGNFTSTLQDKKGKHVGIYIADCVVNIFKNKEISTYNVSIIFDDSKNAVTSYVLFPCVVETEGTFIKKNTTIHAKSTAVGGKYAGKDVKVTIKSDGTDVRKVILEYEK